jgi:tripartite-type tricarboxylate transporter receptor subunit TctC
MLRVGRAAALAVLMATPYVACAQTYPTKPVRIIVGFAPGGSTDTVSRLLAPKLSERLGQPFVVETRAGAAGNIAAEITAKASPDGYTLLMASASHTINASLYSKLPFDAIKDFAPITLVASSPFVLAVHPSVPVRSARDLIALAKSKPGQLSYAAGGATSHLATELFNNMAGIKLVHIPYKSSGPAATDLLGGQVAMMFSAPPAVLPQVSVGKLRALGVSGSRRLSAAADVPTIAESGLPGYEVDSWSGLVAPAAVSRDIITRLNQEVVAAMALPDIRSKLPPLGIEAATNTPEQFGAYLRAEVAKWAKVIRDSGIRQE